MNLSVSYPISLKTNCTNFRGSNAKPVFNRAAEEIGHLISASKDRLSGESNSAIADGLCDMIGKCLGDKYLFQLVRPGKAPSLWLAINRDTQKAIDVVERVLTSKESQGKTYDEIVDNMISELKPPKKEVNSSATVLRNAIIPQLNGTRACHTTVNAKKNSIETCELSEYRNKIIAEVNNEMKKNENVTLITCSSGWGSYIHPTSNPKLFLKVGSDDLFNMTDFNKTYARMTGSDGVFELSALGAKRKAVITVPARELTRNMRAVDSSFSNGVHPFLIDMTRYLNRHPELIRDIEKCIGRINLSKVPEEILQRINACI